MVIFSILMTVISSGAACNFNAVANNQYNGIDLIKEKNIQLSKQVAEYEGIENINSDILEVKDLSGNVFFVVTGKECGLLIYDPISQQYTEMSENSICPYGTSKDADYYYFGPTNYYERIDDTFYSLVYEDDYFDLDTAYSLQDSFDELLVNFRSLSDENSDAPEQMNVLMDDGYSYVDNYQYIRDDTHPTGHNSCGYIAASTILYYWDRTMHDGTVPTQFKNNDGQLNDTYDEETDLRTYLVNNYGKIKIKNGEEYASSTASRIKNVLENYCKDQGLNATVNWWGLDWTAPNELKEGHPVIIFGKLPNPSENGNSMVSHAVTAYGIKQEGVKSYYCVNYGWSGAYSSNEYKFCTSLIGGVTTFSLNDYDGSYMVTPSDYGYPDAYASQETEKTITKGDLSFNTKRLRTGYIQNEYINLSPRREGYGTAYLEYCDFTNPVASIDVDLSFWSNDERYYTQDNPVARVEYKKLCEDEWIEVLDLLDCNLPTDRTNQTMYTIEFEGGTRDFRFYTNFESMSGYTDRNKGRISIGDMVIHTYD